VIERTKTRSWSLTFKRDEEPAPGDDVQVKTWSWSPPRDLTLQTAWGLVVGVVGSVVLFVDGSWGIATFLALATVALAAWIFRRRR
jgi:hypothetical protein